MKPVVYSIHAQERMGVRDMDEALIEKVLANPDEVLDGREKAKIAHKVIGKKLLRVIFKDEGKYYLVITAYITDKDRYGGD